MALKVSWSRNASVRFGEIIEYIEAEFGSFTAKTVAKETYHTLEILIIFPELGSLDTIR